MPVEKLEGTCGANLGWGRAERGRKKKRKESRFYSLYKDGAVEMHVGLYCVQPEPIGEYDTYCRTTVVFTVVLTGVVYTSEVVQ